MEESNVLSSPRLSFRISCEELPWSRQADANRTREGQAMTAHLGRRVAARLNRLKVPGCELACPLGQLLLRWTNLGGRLVVVKRKGGMWVGLRGQAVVWVPKEKQRQK